MRLIDSDALEKTLKRNFCEDCNSYNGVRCRSCQIGDALDALEDAQTIDAVPVVRCKDCKYAAWFVGCPNELVCEKIDNGETHLCVYDDFFCADGKRKNGED